MQLLENNVGQYCSSFKGDSNTNNSCSIKFQKNGLILVYFSSRSLILEFSQKCGLHKMIKDIIHHLKVIPANINDSILIKVQIVHFRPLFAILGLLLAQNAQI